MMSCFRWILSRQKEKHDTNQNEITNLAQNYQELEKPKEFSCPQCYSDYNITDSIQLKCSHYYCRICYYDTFLSETLDKTGKICAECLQDLDSLTYEDPSQMITKPIPLNSTLNQIPELIDQLKYFNLKEQSQEKSNQILSVTPLAFRFLILKVTNHTSKVTELTIYFLPKLDKSNKIDLKIEKNNSGHIDKFNQYFFKAISQEYEVLFADQSSHQILTDQLQLIVS